MTGNLELFQKLIDQGQIYASNLQWKLSVDFYSSALDEIPGQPAALLSLGQAYFALNDLKNALAALGKSVENDPEEPAPLEIMSLIHEKNGDIQLAVETSLRAAELFAKSLDTEKAIKNWYRVTELQPENLIAHTRLAMTFDKLGQKEAAFKEYLATAGLLQRMGCNRNALQVIEYCQGIFPESVEITGRIAELSQKQPPADQNGHFETASIQNAISTTPGENIPHRDPIHSARQNALDQLAALIFQDAEKSPIQFSGDPGNRVFTAAIQAEGTPPENAENIQALIHLGQAIDAQIRQDDRLTAEELQNAIKLGLDHPAAFFCLGAIYSAQNNPAGLMYFERTKNVAVFSIASHLSMGLFHASENKPVKAAQSLLLAFALAEASIADADQTEEIIQYYYEAIQSLEKHYRSDEIHILSKNILTLLMHSDWENNLRRLRQNLPMLSSGTPVMPLIDLLIENDSSQIIEILDIIRGFSNQGKVYSAMEEAFFAIDKAPAYLPLHILIGELLNHLGRTQDAIQKFYVVAQLYELRGEAACAIRLLNRIIQLAPMDIHVRKKIVELLISGQKVPEAIKHTVNLAKMHYQLAELDLARQDYSTALRLALDSNTDRALSVELMYAIADIDMQRLDLRQALRVYEQIRTIEPGDTQARACIVDLNFRLDQVNAALGEADGFISILENSGKRLAAIEFLNGLITDHPNQLDLRKRLANIYVHSGRVVEAVQQLDATAESLLSSGNLEGTIEMVRAIISLNPPNIAHYQAALDQLSRN